ncbi:transcriptional regulator [Sedimentitalea sp. CY04]|uniref:Transcriptional regulator n=1 Tax=Parasedimentitalea denitrificans TaxID=2211118 RepID=A0ABX0WBY9_9RHOB|nr:transcriptional regulator [Sedimentitalea sp. CY04]NIZ62172.1 transcriptional regulator [Sedimentitalea sp. CY04]
MTKLLKINHFGAFGVFVCDGKNIPLGAKHQALLGLLSKADGGIRTRAFLENTLWNLAQPEQAKASLRTALSTLRRHLGKEASQLLTANRERVVLDLDRVEILGNQGSGEFMEGFELPHEALFREWLIQEREGGNYDIPRRRAEVGGGRDYNRAVLDELLPRIAVLPFVYRAPSKGTTPLGSMLSEELVRHLSRSQAFSVTSYLASRQFDPMSVSPTEVASIAGVTYLVSGVVYVKGQEFRLKVDFQDARRERVLWSREYNGSLADLMAGDCDALQAVSQQIGQTAIGESVRQVKFKPLANLDSHTLLMAAISLIQDMRPDQFNAAQDLLGVLLQREPGHPLALTWMGFWHVMRVQKGLSNDRQLDTQLATHLAASALNVDPAFSLAHTLKGMISSHLLFRFDLAQKSYDLALEDNPNEALALLLMGAMRAFQNDPDEAVEFTDAARRLTPLGPQRYYFDSVSATAQLSAGHFARALALADRSLMENRDYPSTLRTKAIALELSGRGEEAREVVRDLLEVSPDFTLSRYLNEHPAAISSSGRGWTRALRAAGVPE